MVSEKLEFRNDEGVMLAGRLEMPAGKPHSCAVFAHCFTCSKDIAAASRISRALSQRGFAVLRFDFTGLGGSDGDFANTNFSSNVEDLVAAARHLGEKVAPAELLVGHSLGGAAVLAAASRIPEVKAVATIGAPSEPAHVRHLLQDELPAIEAKGSATVQLAGRQFEIKRQFLDDIGEQRLLDSLRRLDRAALIMHSPVDEVVDIDHARRLYEALRHPKSFVSLDDADHLLTRRADADYVADVLSAWASRYVEEDTSATKTAEPAEGWVTVDGDARGFVQTVRAGKHQLTADEPESVGGTDHGPTPYDYLLAGLGACTSMTLGMYARHKKWPLEHVGVRLAHRRIHAQDCADCETNEGRVDEIQRELEITGSLDAEQRARLVEIADRCPVHRTLTNEIVIRTNIANE